MTNWRLIALAPAFLLAVACGKKNDQLAADTSLNRDLNLANQMSPYQDTLGAAELRGYSTNPSALRSTTPAHAYTTPTYHRPASSSGGYSSGTTTTTSNGTVSSSGGTVVKHTQRDAAIGAAAGAVIGATTSRNRVKGGIIGAVVGGVLGGVIGNNVDKTKKP
jgi:hypothetical protein